jgi:hypothetical protein
MKINSKNNTMKKVLLLAALAFAFAAHAQKLDKFGSSTEKSIGPKKIRVPYTSTVSYLGYAAPNSEDEVRDGKKFSYIYCFIPLAAPELGVRMLSPVGKNEPKEAARSANYDANKAAAECFDTYITLERCLTILKPEDVTEANVKKGEWITLERNDDSSEMPPNCNGSNYNSLLRYTSKAGDPKGALTVGLYRIGFTTFKTGEVLGTFLAQVAAPIDIPGVVTGRLDQVMTQLKK